MAISSHRPNSTNGISNPIGGPVQKVTSGAASLHNRKPSPLRQSFRWTDNGLVEDVSPKLEMTSEFEFHLSFQYKELYRQILTEVKLNMDRCRKYKRRDKLMELIPTIALVIPLAASILVTINASYKSFGLAIAAGVVGASATCIIAVMNGLKNTVKYGETSQFYHDKAGKLKEIQDHLSFAINLRQFESMDYYEHSSRFELLKELPVGSDITGTAAAATDSDDISEFLRTNTNTTPITHIPKALETKILQAHYASSAKAGYTPSIQSNRSNNSSPTSSIKSKLSNILPFHASIIHSPETTNNDSNVLSTHIPMIRPSPFIRSER